MLHSQHHVSRNRCTKKRLTASRNLMGGGGGLKMEMVPLKQKFALLVFLMLLSEPIT